MVMNAVIERGVVSARFDGDTEIEPVNPDFLSGVLGEDGVIYEHDGRTVAGYAVDRYRAAAVAAIDAAAEAARARIVTPGSGQAMSYLAKETEARRVVAGEIAASPLLDPLVGVEVDPANGTVAADLATVAAIILAQADAWKAIEGALDAARRSAKIAVAGAADVAAIDAARDAGVAAIEAVLAGVVLSAV